MRAWIDSHGRDYFWAKVEAMSEWWHVNYIGGWSGAVAIKPLRKGMSGKRVRFLQLCLRRASHRDHVHYWKVGTLVSAHFGIITRRSVIRFQKRYHLKPDGVVGEKTWRRLKKAAGVK